MKKAVRYLQSVVSLEIPGEISLVLSLRISEGGVMRKTILFSLLVGSLFALPMTGAQGRQKGHPEGSSVEATVPLREAMTRMEAQYLKLAILSSESAMDYNALREGLDNMQSAAQRARKINTNQALDQPLKDLSGRVSRLNRFLEKQDPIRLKKGIDGLYDSCFRCHEAHAPRRM